MSKKQSFPMPKSLKPFWQNAVASIRKSISIPALPRATMEHEVKRPAGYTGI